MADFYQIQLDIPKNSPEYQRWDKLNFILRQIFDRIGNVDGRQSSMSFKNKLDMGGNQISNGPVMTYAQETDYVTKSWFRTAEFGHMAVNLLQSTGKTPLPITGSTGTPQSGGGGGGTGGAVNTTSPLSGGGVPPITISIPKATSSVNGYLSSVDWTTFNSKQDALTLGNLTEATSSVLTITGGAGAVVGVGTTIQVKQASAGQAGYLSAADWTTFNSKQSALTLGNLTEVTSAVLTITGGTGAVVGNVTIQVKVANAGQDGYLSAANWSTFNAKMTNPMTTLGDVIYGGASGAPTRLAGNTTTSPKVLTSTGDGVNAAAPTWEDAGSSGGVGLGIIIAVSKGMYTR